MNHEWWCDDGEDGEDSNDDNDGSDDYQSNKCQLSCTHRLFTVLYGVYGYIDSVVYMM